MSAPHVVSRGVYFATFVAMIAVTALNIAMAFVELGYWNTVIAVGLACVNALLMVAIFMHLKHSARILWLCVGAAAAFFVLMVAVTLSDYRTRDWIKQPQPWTQPNAASGSHAN